MEPVSIEQALVQCVAALDAIEKIAYGQPLAGLAYAAALIVAEIIDTVYPAEAEKEEYA